MKVKNNKFDKKPIYYNTHNDIDMEKCFEINDNIPAIEEILPTGANDFWENDTDSLSTNRTK